MNIKKKVYDVYDVVTSFIRLMIISLFVWVFQPNEKNLITYAKSILVIQLIMLRSEKWRLSVPGRLGRVWYCHTQLGSEYRPSVDYTTVYKMLKDILREK